MDDSHSKYEPHDEALPNNELMPKMGGPSEGSPSRSRPSAIWLKLVALGPLGLGLMYVLEYEFAPERAGLSFSIWLETLPGFSKAMVLAFVALAFLGLLLYIFQGARERRSHSDARSSEAVRPQIMQDAAYSESDAPPGIRNLPSLSPTPLQTGSASRIGKFFALTHTFLRWFTGLNTLLAISLISILLLYFVYKIFLLEGIEAIDEFRLR